MLKFIILRFLAPLRSAFPRFYQKLRWLLLRGLPWLKLIFSRLLQGILVLVVVSALTFALLAATGGDALTALRNDPSVKEETIERLRHTYGLD